MKAAFVIPTKNESETIAEVIKKIREICSEHEIIPDPIIISDDSTDSTREIAKNHGAVVVIGGGRGLGYAMFEGLKEAYRYNVDVIFSADADGQVDLGEIPDFAKALTEQGADIVLGSRFLEADYVHYKYHTINRMGVRILVRILKSLTGIQLTDSHGGLRVMRPKVVKHLELIGNHTYVQEAIIDARENGFKIVEIPSKWLPRKVGKSRVVFSIPKYIFYTLPVLVLRSGVHIRWLFPIGISLILLSLIHISTVFFIVRFNLEEAFNRQSFNLSLLLFSTGLNLFFFGFIFELLANIKRKIH